MRTLDELPHTHTHTRKHTHTHACDRTNLTPISCAASASACVHRMTLLSIKAFHRAFHGGTNAGTGATKFWGTQNCGAAAYCVYIIHPWVYNVYMVVAVEMLKAAGVPIVWINTYPAAWSGPKFMTRDAQGNQAMLCAWQMWTLCGFVFVLAQLTVWPAAYYLRKLPVLNKML